MKASLKFLFVIIVLAVASVACNRTQDVASVSVNVGVEKPQLTEQEANALADKICKDFETRMDAFGKDVGSIYDTDKLINSCSVSVKSRIESNGSIPDAKIGLNEWSKSHEAAFVAYHEMANTGIFYNFSSAYAGQIVEKLKESFKAVREDQ